MNWNEMEILKGIDLNDSFVLSWSLGTDELAFEIEASIWPDSKYYDKPKKNEYTCYKPARLLFKYVKEVNGLLEMAQVTPSTDAKSQKDYGNIDALQENSEGFLIEGDFGSVSIVGGEMNFEIKET
jgi:hypothetical protein